MDIRRLEMSDISWATELLTPAFEDIAPAIGFEIRDFKAVGALAGHSDKANREAVPEPRYIC